MLIIESLVGLLLHSEDKHILKPEDSVALLWNMLPCSMAKVN